MAVIGLGVSVTHAHSAASHQHVHGRGWNLSDYPVVPTSNSGSPADSHRHLLLLGVEFPNDTVPDTTDDGAAVYSAPAVDAGDAAESVAKSFASFDYLSVCSAASAGTTGSVCYARHLSHQPASRLSHFARRTVTGVLRS